MTLFKGHILKSLWASGIWLITCLSFFKGQKFILINSCQDRWLGRRKNHQPKYTVLTQTHLESRAPILIIQEISENWISICHCQNMSLVSSIIFIIIVIIILSLLLISYYYYFIHRLLHRRLRLNFVSYHNSNNKRFIQYS